MVFRKGFSLEKRTFRALVHIYDYHNDENQKKQSDIARIPLKQFNKSLNKHNTGEIKKITIKDVLR